MVAFQGNEFDEKSKICFNEFLKVRKYHTPIMFIDSVAKPSGWLTLYNDTNRYDLLFRYYTSGVTIINDHSGSSGREFRYDKFIILFKNNKIIYMGKKYEFVENNEIDIPANTKEQFIEIIKQDW